MDDSLLGSRLPADDSVPGVHVGLKDLVRQKFSAKGFSFLPRQPIHSLLSGKHTSRLRGRGLDFQEIRQYRPGDDIRQIDWKASLRLRKTQTRVYTEERERSVILLVDQRISMFFGSRLNMKSVTAAEAAALAAWRVIQQGDRIGGMIFNDTEITEISPRRSQSNVMQMLGEIARMNRLLSHSVETKPAPDMLNRALRQCERIARHDCLVCLVTDASGHDEETRGILTRIASHNDVLFAFVSDPMEAALPEAGPLVFSDGRNQLEADTGSRKLRERYGESFAAFRRSGRKFLIHRETPVIPLDTTEDTAKQLRRLLGNPRR